jgi:uncharacterized protein (TIGR02270 family)
MGQSTAIRWDIAEEHLDEAAFLRQLWEEALRSPDYSLAEIAEGPEERMLAHLDGLVLGGARVARRLLLPALGGEEPGPVFAAAFALLASEDGDFAEPVLEALARAEPPARAAIRRALALAPVPALGPRLAALAPRAAGAQADLLEVLAYLRIDPGLRLEPLVSSSDPAVQALAIRLSRFLPGRLDPFAVERALASPREAVRSAALEAGMVAGARGAFAAAEAAAAAPGPGFAAAALILGLSGDEKSAAALLPALRDPGRARAAAFALGFSGRVSAADALLAAMADEDLAPVAAEGFAAIAGLGVEGAFARPPRRWTPGAEEGEGEGYGPEADLPAPDPAAAAEWWKEARPRLDPAQRWMRGQPWGAEALFREMERGPARRREALALEIAIRTRGQVQLAWDALSSRQRAEAAEARGAAGRPLLGPFREATPAQPARQPPRAPPPAAAGPARRTAPVPPGALAITGLGMVSSLGEGAAACCAAARAGVVRPRPLEGPRLWDPEAGGGEPPAGHAATHADGFSGLGRIASLACAGLQDLLRQPLPADGGRLGLFLVLPSPLLFRRAAEERDRETEREAAAEEAGPASPGDEPEEPAAPPEEPGAGEALVAALRERLVPTLLRHLPLPAPPARTALFCEDAPGLASALAACQASLQAGQLDRCIVGGVDSLVDPEALAALAQLDLLKTSETPTGLMPGEGAAFLLVERGDAAARRKARVEAWIDAVAARAEPPPAGPDAPPTGRALAGAIADALRGLPDGGRETGLLVGSLNGTASRALEWGSALVRLQKLGLPGAREIHPALHFGELGAASGPAAVCLAARAFARRAPSPNALVWLSGESGARAALYLRAP